MGGGEPGFKVCWIGKDFWNEKVQERPEFVHCVLDGSACYQESMLGFEFTDKDGEFGLFVLIVRSMSKRNISIDSERVP